MLFNNAGIAATHPVEDVMAVNWLGLRQLSEGLLPKIKKGGAIANTASIAGWVRRRLESQGPQTKALQKHQSVAG